MEKIDNSKIKVFVAMSGGVDSSVAAALLKAEGYDITGVFMKNWSGDDFGIQTDCPWEKDQKDVENVCKKLNIPFRSFNFEKEYREKVVEYFFDEIRAGRTPNPDVMCNKEIKFGIFLEKAIGMGADMIATGHYSRVELDEISGKFSLLKGIDNNKDQTYFLNQLNQDSLSKTLFPIGKYTKPEVRELAQKFGLSVASKPDSQGICFIGEINVAQFLRANVKIHKGNIIDKDNGKIVGVHDGIEFYTIGQREGLNIGGAKEPYFVIGKDKSANILYVAMGKNNPLLFSNEVGFSEIHYLYDGSIRNKSKIEAAIRYRQKPSSGTIDLENNKFLFDTPQRAVAEGQSIVFYEGDECLGSGIITNN